MAETENWKSKTLVMGAIMGAGIGLLGAYILIKRSEQTQTQPRITAGEGVKLGTSLLAVLKLISEFSDRK